MLGKLPEITLGNYPVRKPTHFMKGAMSLVIRTLLGTPEGALRQAAH